jgi:hypothetical protein
LNKQLRFERVWTWLHHTKLAFSFFILNLAQFPSKEPTQTSSHSLLSIQGLLPFDPKPTKKNLNMTKLLKRQFWLRGLLGVQNPLIAIEYKRLEYKGNHKLSQEVN